MGLWSRIFGKTEPPPAAAPPDKVWVMGTSARGGVLLECGAMELALALLPVDDVARYRQLPSCPAGATALIGDALSVDDIAAESPLHVLADVVRAAVAAGKRYMLAPLPAGPSA